MSPLVQPPLVIERFRSPHSSGAKPVEHHRPIPVGDVHKNWMQTFCQYVSQYVSKLLSNSGKWHTTLFGLFYFMFFIMNFEPLQWRHNGHDSVLNHQPHDWLLNRLFRRRSKKTSKLSYTGLSAGNSPGTGEFPAQRASNAENVSIWWRLMTIR